jgi:hypothetical protein
MHASRKSNPFHDTRTRRSFHAEDQFLHQDPRREKAARIAPRGFA